MRTTLIVTGLLSLLLLAPANADEKCPYPTGTSTQRFADMEFTLILPTDYDPARKHPLIIGLHGRGGRGANIASGFAPLAREGWVVVGPQSSAMDWDQPNVKRAKEVLAHLLDVLSIDEKKLHGAAYSQACPFLSPIVFDKKFHFITASWGMGGSNGGSVPKWGKKEMGVIALAGSEDWGRGAAEGTVRMFAKKVKNAQCHLQHGLGHEFPIKLVPYHLFWLKVMNGWFVPGEVSPFFDWSTDLEAAKKTMAGEKRGGFVYFYSKDDGENAEARRFQSEVLLDAQVMHYGRQAVCVRLEREKHEALFQSLKLKTTPAAVVTKPDFTPVATLEGKKASASKVGKALRKVAKDRKKPEKPGVHLHR